jgi:hypothetical protein
VVMGSAVMSDMTRKRRSSALKRRRGTGGLQLAPFPFTAAGGHNWPWVTRQCSMRPCGTTMAL